MRHRLERHNPFGLRLLSLIETLNLGTKPDRKVGRLDKRPAEIFVAVLGVALAFFLAVADLLTPQGILAWTLLTSWTKFLLIFETLEVEIPAWRAVSAALTPYGRRIGSRIGVEPEY